ncbi:MAG: hypothetical protein Q7S19_03255 [bacterium]|nr:hypothetical protein [bacterium]
MSVKPELDFDRPRQVTKIPVFPENSAGLNRGSVLEITSLMPEAAQLGGLKVGKKIMLGYDGTHIRSGPLIWLVEKIIEEIAYGWWKVIEVPLPDFSNAEFNKEFALIIEHLELVPVIKLDS